MPTFRDNEKVRQVKKKNLLFSSVACSNGTYNGKVYDFCLEDNHSEENIFVDIRQDAIDYFDKRNIEWHDGKGYKRKKPSNHLCCSQSFCVNALFPYIYDPDLLKSVLLDLGYPVEEMLPFEEFEQNSPLNDGIDRYVCFEWIGKKNYLSETKFGKEVSDSARTRGQGFTSADFAFRFRRVDKKIQIVLGEWKYTEEYRSKGSIRFSGANTDRLKIYSPALDKKDSPIHLIPSIPNEELFFDPFDQIMRLQLLAKEMEKSREMDAEIVTVLHFAPKLNKELMDTITSKALAIYGTNIHNVWNNIAECGKFKGIYTETLLETILKYPNNNSWKCYMEDRYRF